MSEFRVCKIKNETKESVQYVKFDNKEDAEHYAKNQSTADHKHGYEVQKNKQGQFATIKSYWNGESSTTSH